VDDEVRDRAALYLRVLNEQALADVYVREGECWPRSCICFQSLIGWNLAESTFPLASLETELAAYVKHPEKQEQAFDINNIPKISRAQAAAEVPRECNS
jgi:coatomer protein complex subunit gamma